MNLKLQEQAIKDVAKEFNWRAEKLREFLSDRGKVMHEMLHRLAYAVEQRTLVLEQRQVINDMCDEIDIDQLQPELAERIRALATIDQEKEES